MNASNTQRWGVAIAGVGAAFIGGFWLAAWWAGLAGRWSAAGTTITMKTNMAFGLLVAGTALLMLGDGAGKAIRPRRWVGGVLAMVVLLLGSLTLSEHLLHTDLGIDQLLATEPAGAAATLSPNRIGYPGCISHILLGMALLTMGLGRRRPAAMLGLAVCVINLIPAVGYLYGIHEFYTARPTGIAWETVLAMLLLGSGVVLSQREVGPMALLLRRDAGGMLLRRLLPAAVLLPLGLGFFRVLGQHHGLYDTAMGTGLLVLSLIVIFSTMLWRNARQLSIADRQQKQAEAEVRRLAAFPEENPDPIIRAGRDGRLLYANRPAASLLAMMGWQGDGPLPEPLLSAVRQVGAENGLGEVECTCPQGRVFSFALASIAAEDYINLYGRDVTERRRAEESLRKSEEQLRVAATAAEIGMWSWKPGTSDVMVSANWRRLFGVSDTATVTFETWREALHPADRERAVSELNAASEEHREFNVEYRVIWPDGTWHWIIDRGRAWYDQSGKPVGMAGVNVDMTKGRRAELDQALSLEVLRVLNPGAEDMHALMDEVLRLVRERTGFDAVGLRLREGEDCPYYAQAGLPDVAAGQENCPCAKGADGSVVPGAGGEAALECACGLVLSGRIDPSKACFTEGGSFWTNRSSDLAGLGLEGDGRTNPRNRCIHAGYESVGLIPVRYGEQIVGLLELNDHQPGRFSPEYVRFFEGLANNLGMALQRKRAEEALKESEERFRTMADAMPQLAWMAHADGFLHWYNRRWYEYTGTTPQEMEGWGWQSVHDPVALPKVLEQWKASIATGEPFEMVFPLRGADGQFRRFLTRGQPLKDAQGRVVQWFGTNTDVDELKRAQEAQSLLAAIVESSEDAILSKSLDGAILSWNAGAEKLLGYRAEEVIGKPVMLLLPPERVQEEEQIIARLSRGERIDHYETVRVAKDGRRIEVSVTVSPLKDRDGHVVGASKIIHDITARKRVEEKLRASEMLLRSATDNAAVGLVMLDRDRRYTFANPAYCSILALDLKADELIGKGPAEVLAPVYATQISPRLDRAFAGERVSYELTRPGAEGRDAMHYVVVYDPTRGGAGAVDGVIVTIFDITARKRAEAALKQSEAQLRTIVENLSEGLVVSDLQGNLLEWNRAALEMHGLASLEEARRRLPELADTFELAAPDGTAWTPEQWPLARILRGETLRDLEVRVRNTKEHWQRVFRYGGSIVHDESGRQWLAVVMMDDITQRKEAEAALRESEERYRSLFDELLEGFCIIEVLFDEENRPVDYRFLEINPAFEGQTGLHDAQGKRMRELAPNHEAHWFELYGKVALTGKPARFVNEASALNRWYDVSAYRIGGPDSRKVAILFNDITEAKRAEQRLKRVAQELARSNKDLEQFAYVASHDLQEPLRMVTGYLQLIDRRYKDKLDQDARDFINFAVDGSTRMSRLITDLLDFSRINTRGKPPEPVAMEAVLARALANLEAAIGESGAQITHDPLPTVPGDGTQLAQLLQNLVGNAIKFRSPDRPVCVCIGVEKKEDAWVFSVKDNGIGIEAQYAEKIFLLFQRLHSRGEYPGTGIGLAICKRIVERHGGRIWVESQPGEGSTFFFTIGGSGPLK